MDIYTAGKLIEKYAICPECGNEYIGNENGTLLVEENYFQRTCKCGWGIKVDENDMRGIL